MLLTRLDHVQIAIPSGAPAEEQARAFYVDLLALVEIPKPPILAARGGLWLQGAGFQLHLGVEPDFRPAKRAHPAFRVSDLDHLARILQTAGVSVAWDDAFPGQRRFYAGDPFGNRLEFMAA